MSLSVGIVGLPNAGKSTLFNALAARRLAETAPRPFTTIAPHEAIVDIPDENLVSLSNLLKPEVIVPATIKFVDIAGLVRGAHKGEGLGNQFLAKIREVNAIAHVVRGFTDPYVSHVHQTHEAGTLEQILDDIEIVSLELQIANIIKPTIFVINLDEKKLASGEAQRIEVVVSQKFFAPAISVCAKLEEDLSDFPKEERSKFLQELNLKEDALAKFIKKAYEILSLITFYTIKGGKEIRAVSIKKGDSVIEAAEKIHSEFAEKFIKAEVVNVGSLLESGGWVKAKEKGLIRIEGRDYIVQDGDVIEFKVGA